ncbi:MAG: DeoR/GlpR transcriptional regulator, partial [Ruminococcaceae bacterium]|nr:DeoR/GlpR transcriptional regulator [Oscillospiraceae bacterium]
EKQYICTLARDFISQGMSVFLDSSSTVEQLCPMLAEYQSLTVMTNGINNALRLNELDNIETYITGGRMENGSHTVLGEMAGQLFSGFKADVAFISCRGVASDGCFEANHQQALIKQNMMKNAKSTVLLFDSSKANKSYFYRLAEFSSLTAVITDKKPDDALADAIASSGCELLY